MLNGETFGTHTRVNEVFVEGKSAYANKPVAKATIVQGRSIYTGTGDVIANGSILVEGGKVRGIGRDVSAPADASLRRFTRGVIVPGFVDFGAGLGLGGPLSSQVALNTHLGERLVSGDPSAGIARQGGVTTVLLASSAAGTGPVIAFKLGDKPNVIQDPVAIRFSVTGNLTTQGASCARLCRPRPMLTFPTMTAQAEYLKKKNLTMPLKPRVPASANGAAPAKTERSPMSLAPDTPSSPRQHLEPYRAFRRQDSAWSTNVPMPSSYANLPTNSLRTPWRAATTLSAWPPAGGKESRWLGPSWFRPRIRPSTRPVTNWGPCSFHRRPPRAEDVAAGSAHAVRCGLGSEILAGLTSGPAKLLP